MSDQQFNTLKSILGSYQQIVVAYSGGVDSAFLLKVCVDVLGTRNVKAITASSPSVPKRELEEAKRFAALIGAEHLVVETRELENPNYSSNPTNRCYFCKTELYEVLRRLALEWGIQTICNGATLSDLGDWRPGLSAARERDIKSPLIEAGFRKEDIRRYLRRLSLSIWDKPASPCLSSRFPYGNEITEEKLGQVEAGEDFIHRLGFREFRLRHLGAHARLELGELEFQQRLSNEAKGKIEQFIRTIGFDTVSFERYRSGRMNEEAGVHSRIGQSSS